MATKRDLTRQERITKEERRLKKIYKELDKNKLLAVESLIRNAAFMTVTLEDLHIIINEKGYTEEYQNGKHQKGRKQSDAVKTYIAITRNHSFVMKQLADLAPPAPRKDDWLQKLRDE